MKVRIRECGHGGYTVEIGTQHDGGVLAPNGIGHTMPAFIVYESAHFDTLKQAERYAERRAKEKRLTA